VSGWGTVVSGGVDILALHCAEEDKLVSDILVFDEVDSQVSGQGDSLVSGHTLADIQVSDLGHNQVSDLGHILESAGLDILVSGPGKQDCDQVSAVGTQVTVLENEVFGMQVSDQVVDTQVSDQGRQECVQVSAVGIQVSLL